jgi:hypothetical protein
MWLSCRAGLRPCARTKLQRDLYPLCHVHARCEMREAFVVRSTDPIDPDIRSARPARPRPTSATHDAGAERHSRVCWGSVARLTKPRLRRNGMSYEVGGGRYAEPVRGVVIQGKPSSCCNSDADCRRVHREAQLLLCKRLGCRGSAAHAFFP